MKDKQLKDGKNIIQGKVEFVSGSLTRGGCPGENLPCSPGHAAIAVRGCLALLLEGKRVFFKTRKTTCFQVSFQHSYMCGGEGLSNKLRNCKRFETWAKRPKAKTLKKCFITMLYHMAITYVIAEHNWNFILKRNPLCTFIWDFSAFWLSGFRSEYFLCHF